MKKNLFTITCALLLCGVLTACGISSPEPSKIGNVTKEPTAENTNDTKKTTEAPIKDIYQVGDIVEINGRKMIYTSSGEYVSSNQFMQPGDGNKYIYLEFYVENIGSGTVSVSYFDFDAYADGYAVDQKYFDEDSLSGGLSAGRWEIGKIYFEVPANASEIEAEYEYDVFNSKKLKFAYEGEKNSGFVPEPKTTPTDGAFKPGDIIDAGDLKISYLSCDFFESGNKYIQPDEGNVYIYLEFEMENISGSDQTVSVLNFDCFADGRVCRSTSLRDDDLSATISPGRKAKGTVAFQVPKDAAVIEVEFVNNLFFGKPIIFSFGK